jgi:hypothetical protein
MKQKIHCPTEQIVPIGFHVLMFRLKSAAIFKELQELEICTWYTPVEM